MQMEFKLKSVLIVCTAVVCLFIGLVGIVVPILPGIPFLLLSLVCVASLIPPLRHQLHRQPRVRRFMGRVDAAHNLSLPARIRLLFWASLEAINPRRV